MTPITTPGGEELVLLPRAEYDALVEAARAAATDDDAVEDEWARNASAASKARLESGEDVALPEAVFEALEAGQNRLRVLREHRGMTQEQLARESGVAQPYVSQIERGQRTGSVRSLGKIAGALKMPLSLLVGE